MRQQKGFHLPPPPHVACEGSVAPDGHSVVPDGRRPLRALLLTAALLLVTPLVLGALTGLGVWSGRFILRMLP